MCGENGYEAGKAGKLACGVRIGVCLRCGTDRCSIAGTVHEQEGNVIATILTVLVILIHVYIVLLEMLWWDTPRGRKAFGTTEEFAAATKTLAANQGLYNGFLAAGLAWGLWLGQAGFAVTSFFLGCVLVAGLFGAATSSMKILYVQAIPAALALIALYAGL